VALTARRDICGSYFPEHILTIEVVSKLAASIDRLTLLGLAVPKTDWINAAPESIRSEVLGLIELANEGMLADVVRRSFHITAALRAASSTFVDGLSVVGATCFGRGDRVSAEEIWQRALVVDPTSFPCRFNLAV